MGDWNPLQTTRYAETDSSNTSGITITCGSANVKGAYAQLIASTLFDAHALIIQAQVLASSANAIVLMDVAVGAAASESVVIPNLFLGQDASLANPAGAQALIPIMVPKGQRLSARAQSSTGSLTLSVKCQYLQSGWPSLFKLGRCTQYGANTGTSNGTTLTAGTANVKGAWVQLSASTAAHMKWAILQFGDFANQSVAFFLDIGVGGAGSEVVVVPNIFMGCGNSGAPYNWLCIPLCIPAGTRLAARVQSGSGGATLNVAVMGVD